MNSTNGRLQFIWMATMSIVFFAACSLVGEAKDETTLKKVARQYWTDRLVETRDYQGAFKREKDLVDPFETYRGQVSRNEKFKFSNLKIGDVKIEGDQAILYVALKCKVPQIPRVLERNFKDIWYYDSGKWKHKFSKNQP